MDDFTKNISDKVARIEKEGTPVRGLATCGRLFVEKAYKSTVSTFSPVQVQNLFAERVNLFSKSLNIFKKNNQVCCVLLFVYNNGWALIRLHPNITVHIYIFMHLELRGLLFSVPLNCRRSHYCSCCRSHSDE
jgi:hypothetical protein